ncbi:MAG: CsgG/HfaB family protein [Gammaproteobacteria bacterium]|nr:CsgG/HfaB family protein [Gammaproteobacteria bacterium]MBU1629439.1 CsgG/HfaB family protein [Gammaproteobacteria bacterium]MBU1927348.1 CsgG/HfaB family protein [Gammaproteobacteria bacterium]
MLKELRFVIVLGGILVLSGCASTKEEIRPSDEKPDDQLQQIRSLEERAKILKEKVAPTLDDSINELVQQISKDMTVQKKTTIAVIDFTNLEGNVTNFGRYLTEELITRLFQTGKFKVIERNLLNKVIEEQKLSLTQLIDPASAKQLGRILGVDAIVSGTIGDLVKQLKVNARIIGTEKGDVLAVAQTAINKNEAVKRLMEEGVKGASTAQEEAKTPSTPVSTPTPKKPIQTMEAGGFLFALEECKKSGGDITFDFTVTNKNTDFAWIYLGERGGDNYFYLQNDLGNQYNGIATLGNGSSKRKYLDPQASIKLTIRFSNVKQEGKVFPAFSMYIMDKWFTSTNIIPLSE